MQGKQEDLTGQKFGRWLVLRQDDAYPKGHGTAWICRCDCGTESSVSVGNLKSGDSQSCGCRRVAHGYLRGVSRRGQRPPEYQTWQNIKRRCYNPKNASYARYGGRGITVCDAWRDSFEQFLQDMGPRPGTGYSIERLKTDGPYSPENCVWATAREQQRNRRATRFLTYNGRTQSMADWARESGLKYNTLCERLRHGWTLREALDPILVPGRKDNT